MCKAKSNKYNILLFRRRYRQENWFQGDSDSYDVSRTIILDFIMPRKKDK